MCGIVGFQGDYPPDLLRQMTDAVAHRGPDAQGQIVSRLDRQPPTGLGHRRLAIIDLSDAGCQPMTIRCGDSPPGDLTLVYNGEIYNYRELRADLVSRGHQFTSETDSEVLLHLYEAYGCDMLGKLNGIFAFAIHDARERGLPDGMERGALFVARDPLGVKPLYYSESQAGFLFGSEIKALLRAPGLDRTLDAAALHQTLAYLWTPAPRTLLRSVRKLEPGSALIVSGGRVRRRWTYYSPPYDGQVSTASQADLAAELATRLETAVDRQLVSDVPVGAFLSGGLDSSAVVAMMRKVRPSRPITAFTIAFEDDEDVEGNPQDLPYARKAAAHLDVSLQEILVPSSAIRRLEEMIRLLDEPQADPAPINALMIAEAARAMGIPVLLSGAGGDDIFGGYGRHWAVQFERRWAWLPHGVRARLQAVAQWAASGHGYGQSIHSARRLAKMFAYAAEEPDRRIVSHFLWSTDDVRRGLYTHAFAQETADMDVGAPLLRTLRRIPRESDRLQRMLWLEAVHFLADHNLNYTDRAGMAVGVEVRVPLLDLDLVKFAATIPSSMKQAGRVGKPLFKKAMEPYLPREVIYRPKSGFGMPLRRWLRSELRDLVHDTLSADVLRRRGVFEPAAVARLVDLDRRGMVDGSYTILALLSFEVWCRTFVDGSESVVDRRQAAPVTIRSDRHPDDTERQPVSTGLEAIKGTVESLPEPVGRMLARVPFVFRLGPTYVRTTRALRRPPLSAEARFRELRALVAHAATQTTFYREFYASRGFSVDQLQTPEDWGRVPVVTKADMQACPLESRVSGLPGLRINTGGTSGQPLEFLLDKQAFAREWAHMHTLWGAHGYHWRTVKLTLRGKHFDPRQPLRFNALHNEYVANASCPTDVLVDAVLAPSIQAQVRWVHGYPSLVAEFCHALERRPPEVTAGFRSRVLGVLLGSEYPAPAYREVIERVLSSNVVSWYGHSEMAVLAGEVEPGTYRSLPTYGYAEAVPVDEGSGYRLLATSMHNRAHPFIRYDTGDLIEPVANSGGALTFRVTDGRVGEFVADRTGRRHSLTALIFGRHHPAFDLLRHVQVRDEGAGRITLVVTPRELGLAASVIRRQFDLANVDIDWEIEVVDQPVRTTSGKIKLLI